MPAVGADGDPGVEEDQGQGQPAPIDPREGIPDLGWVLPTEGQDEKEETDRQTDPDAR